MAGGGASGRGGGGSALSLHEHDYLFINLSTAIFVRLRCFLFAFEILILQNCVTRKIIMICSIKLREFPTLQIHSASYPEHQIIIIMIFIIEWFSLMKNREI